jgi:hypothetical protein
MRHHLEWSPLDMNCAIVGHANSLSFARAVQGPPRTWAALAIAVIVS